MARDAKADLAVCDAASKVLYLHNRSFEAEEIERSLARQKVARFAAYWINLTEAYKELAGAQDEMLNRCETIGPWEDRDDELTRKIEHLTSKTKELEARK